MKNLVQKIILIEIFLMSISLIVTVIGISKNIMIPSFIVASIFNIVACKSYN